MDNLKKEKTYTDKKHIKCSGHEAPYDHPTIYLEVNDKSNNGEDAQVECPYCSHIFIFKK